MALDVSLLVSKSSVCGDLASHPAVEFAFDNLTRSRETLAGSRDQVILSAGSILYWCKHPRPEGCFVTAVLEEFHDCLISIEISDGGSGNGFAQFFFQHLGVRIPNPEGDQRADVAKNSLANRQGQLIDVLMRKSEAQTIFAGFCEKGSKGIG